MKIKIRNNVEITSEISLDSIRYSLQNQLTTQELISFAYSLGDKLTDATTFYISLEAKCVNKMINDDSL